MITDNKGSLRRRVSVLGLAVVAIFVLSACGGGSDKTDSEPTSSADPADQIESTLAERWTSIQQSNPGLKDTPRPEVAVVRIIELDEYATAMVSCLHESGFPDVKATADGGLEVFLPTDAAVDAYDVANYTCEAKYPVDPRYMQPFSEAQLEKLYAHFKGPLTECIEDAGYDVSKPSSVEEFVENYNNGTAWDPLNEVLASLNNPSEITALQAECPLVPSDIYD